MELSPALVCSATYETLLGAIFVFVSYGALSGTNASSTGLQNLMEATLGHEQPLARGTKQASYPPF